MERGEASDLALAIPVGVTGGGGAGLPPMEAMQGMTCADDEVRECIRRLVAVIRRSSTGGSPVDHDQVEHIKKVIRVLSLSEEQVSSMRFEERAKVLNIRANALQKMRLANSVRSSAHCSDGTGSSAGSSPPTCGSPIGLSPPGPSSYGSSFQSWPSPLSSSAPTAMPMQAQAIPIHARSASNEPIRPPDPRAADFSSMPPPAFYTRKSL